MSNNNLSTEIWRDIAGYEGIYQVSNTGKVRRVGGEYFEGAEIDHKDYV